MRAIFKLIRTTSRPCDNWAGDEPRRDRGSESWPGATLLAATLILTLVASPPLLADGEAGDPMGVAGQVRGPSEPLDAARVYVYHLADFRLEKAVTDAAGRFLFEDLPAGLYKVIAYKNGFVPAVIQITRAAADSYQFLDLELPRDQRETSAEAADFWSVRSKIPGDVLREITLDEMEDGGRLAQSGGALTRGALTGAALPDGLRLDAEMLALTGVDQIATAEGQVFGGQVGIQGQLGELQIDLTGNYRQLQSRAPAPTATVGQTSGLSLNLANGDDTQVTLTSLSNRMDGLRPAADSVDFEHYRVSVSQNHGERARTELSAQYTDESNFHRHGLRDPAGIPQASRVFRLAGSYARQIGDGTTFETGMRYWQREYDAVGGEAMRTLSPLFPAGDERMDFYGRGGTRLQPTVLVEYGLYTRLTDGSLSLAPRGGLVVNLGSAWQATTTVSHRVETGVPIYDFLPTLQQRNDDCADSEAYCYRLLFTRSGKDEEESVTFGAVHREYAETLRLYFSDDFFDRLESLYLVPGDRLPEVQFALTRKLAPKILARLEGNLATGGGGIFYATEQREAFENEVRYLVTSLDTRFQSSSTGVFLAFHHLQQQLNPLTASFAAAPGTPPQAMELDRLQLMLTQDLNVLLNLTRNWAVHLNMELSRGSDFFDGLDHDEELRKRILGGIAIKF